MSMLKVIGHRGAGGLAPENTIAAIQAGLAAGADEIEIDLHFTLDGIPVLSHDAYIMSCDGSRLRIRDHHYATLRKHTPDLATLHEAVKVINHAKPLLIELKRGEPVMALIECLQNYFTQGYRPADFAVLSFDQTILRILHRDLPEVPLVVNEPWSGIRARRQADELSTKRINMNARWLWRGFLRAMNRRGYQIAAYTINQPRATRRFEPYIYGVITDYPDRFKTTAKPNQQLP